MAQPDGEGSSAATGLHLPAVVFETLFALLYGFMWEQRLPTVAEIGAFIFVISGVVACIGAHRNVRS